MLCVAATPEAPPTFASGLSDVSCRGMAVRRASAVHTGAVSATIDMHRISWMVHCMTRSTTPSFARELPRVLVGADERHLLIRLDAARQAYNAAPGESLRRLKSIPCPHAAASHQRWAHRPCHRSPPTGHPLSAARIRSPRLCHAVQAMLDWPAPRCKHHPGRPTDWCLTTTTCRCRVAFVV